jgi:hypothetical protein
MKTQKYMQDMTKIAIILVLISLMFGSCQDQTSREEAIQMELKKKRDEHFNYRFDACRQLLIKDVEAHVDSVLYMEIVLGLHGDVEIPARPDRGGDTTDYDVILDTTSLDLKDLDQFISR